MEESIYHRIERNLAEGRLPASFHAQPGNPLMMVPTIPGDPSSQFIQLPDGYLEGHMQMSEYALSATKGRYDLIGPFVKAAIDGMYSKADDLLPRLLDGVPVISLEMKLSVTILRQLKARMAMGISKRDSSDTRAYDCIREYGLRLIKTSHHTERVKMGLTLLRGLADPDERVKHAVRTLGYCNEYTYFAAAHMMSWVNGNGEIYALAQETSGWGQLNAIGFLDPRTQNMRDFIYRVAAEYSYQVSGFGYATPHGASAAVPPDANFHAVGKLLMEEIARMQYGSIANAAYLRNFMTAYIDQAFGRELEDFDRQVLLAIEMAATNDAHDMSRVMRPGNTISVSQGSNLFLNLGHRTEVYLACEKLLRQE